MTTPHSAPDTNTGDPYRIVAEGKTAELTLEGPGAKLIITASMADRVTFEVVHGPGETSTFKPSVEQTNWFFDCVVALRAAQIRADRTYVSS